MLKRLRPLTLIAVALLAGALALPAHALQFNYSTRLTLTDCDDADEAGFNTGTTTLCYDLTAAREEIWNGSAWVAYQGGGAAITSIVPGTGATNAGKARSSSAGATDTGFAPWAVRDDALSTVAEDEGEYTPLKATSTGGLWMSIATPLGDSAMDDTVDAVKVLNYVSENAATATAADIDQTGAKTIITVDVGAVQASRLYCIFQNTDVAANTNLDEFNIYMAPAGYTATSMPVAYTEADFASPSGALLMVRTGAGGDTTDATPDTTLDESDYMIIWLDVGGMDSVTFQASAAADNAAVDAKCTYN